FTQFVDATEHDRLGRAGLRARRYKGVALPGVAQRAFVGMAIAVAAADDPERTLRHAMRASVAHVALYQKGLNFALYDRAGGTGLQAGSGQAVLADVAHHQPAIPHRFK